MSGNGDDAPDPRRAVPPLGRPILLLERADEAGSLDDGALKVILDCKDGSWGRPLYSWRWEYVIGRSRMCVSSSEGGEGVVPNDGRFGCE